MSDSEIPPEESGLIIPVPAFDEFVSTWRTEIAGVPPYGVPAHVTLLYPFVSPGECLDALAGVRDFFAHLPPFSFEMSEIGWFDQRVVFVRPKPAEAFNEITVKLTENWDQCIPYGGKHAEPVPHLSLCIDGDLGEMRRMASAAEALLPLQCEATEAWLMVGRAKPPSWRIMERFPIGTALDADQPGSLP